MARDDAEPTPPAGEEPRSAKAGQERPGRRQRAVDLFSPHRYRALQLSLFERKRGGGEPEATDAAWDDDAADPPLMSDAPAARAAREVVSGTVRGREGHMLTPVPMSQDGHEDADATAEPSDSGHLDPEFREREEDFDSAGDYPTEVFAGAEYASPDADDIETPDPDGGKQPRSSRNFVVATVVGLLLLGVTLASAWYHPTAFAVVLYGFCIAAVIEWKRALERHGRRVAAIPLVAATVGLGVATHFAKPEGLVVALLVGCAGIVAWRIGDERVENTLADSLAGVLTLLWIPFLASFLYLLELADDGWQRVFIVVLAVVGNDTGALVFGMLFGKHKLLERVSPAKTWEGAIGGVFVGTAAASVAAWFFFEGQWYIGAAVGAAATLAAIVGDLAESALKRDIRVKDMSQALPGHGGILDRIDSLLFAAPVGYVVFAIFLGTLGGGGL
ncbi:MAG TPA: phosphatidate cytidylyltransferase [Demequina sp.]|nr:phosphatidate cytidylyltransferase [Demequina sp.]